MSLIQFRPKHNDVVPSLWNEDMFLTPFFPASALKRNQEEWYPALDVSEDENRYRIEADVPGLRKEDVQLSFNEGVLTIEGERKQESQQKEKNYYRMERSYGKFLRSINIGTAVDANSIKANYKDGVLYIEVPKSEKAKPKSIDIHVG